MKLTNLNEQYLSGLIDMAITEYHENLTPLPEFCNLNYKFEFGTDAGKKNSVRVVFAWIANGLFVCVDKDTDSYELTGEKCDRNFTLLLSDSIGTLRSHIHAIMDCVTA